MVNYFPSNRRNPYAGETGALYKFQGSQVEADHPPEGDSSNKVATTEWVKSIVDGLNLDPPIIYKAGDLIVKSTEGSIPNLFGGNCHINATREPIGVKNAEEGGPNRVEFAWVRYSDCGLVVTVEPPADTVGAVLAQITIDETQIIEIVNINPPIGGLPEGPISFVDLATLDSPNFTGEPTSTNPPADDDSNRIATTGWVQDELEKFDTKFDALEQKVEDALAAAKQELDDAIQQLQEEIDTRLSDMEDRITQLEERITALEEMLSDNGVMPGEYPTIIPLSGMSIRVNEGKVPLPSYPSDIACSGSNCQGEYCEVNTADLTIPVSEVTRQVWLRYSDCLVVTGSEIPKADEGFRLAEVHSDGSSITGVHQLAGTPEGRISNLLAAGYGGTLDFNFN